MIIDSAMATGLKRKATGGMAPTRRIKTSRAELASFAILNLQDGDIVHQACLLLTGSAPTFENSNADYIALKVTDGFTSSSSVTNWPSSADWKALLQLQPGLNNVTLELRHVGGIAHSIKIHVVYQPLLQVPPLHLAIMVAKDSPLTIDCPAAKYGAISSAHSSLDSAIDKFRTTARMWQALTGEQLRLWDAGRRSFRLEEEWMPSGSSEIKVHIVRSDKTVAQIQAMASEEALHNTFLQALIQHGGPFASRAKPVVAGLILDARFDIETEKVLGFASRGKHNAKGVSLAVYSSHLTYSWPRNLHEVSSSLLDTARLDDTVGCGAKEQCNTYQDACSTSQLSFLFEVGQAFGLDDRMLVGVANEWRHFFVPAGNGRKSPDLRLWNLGQALRLKATPHFRIPGDELLTAEFCDANIRITVNTDADGDDSFEISCPGALMAYVTVRNGDVSESFDLLKNGHDTATPVTSLSITDLDSYSRDSPLIVHAIATNGKTKELANAWRYLADRPYITIPASENSNAITLHKYGIKDLRLEQNGEKEVGQMMDEREETVPWTVLFQGKPATGTVVTATKIETRVGSTFDGAMVHYNDGSLRNCGPRFRSAGQTFRFGGSSSFCELTPDVRVVKVEVQKQRGCLDGVRITLSNGQSAGHLNDRSGWGWGNDLSDKPATVVLEPTRDERVVGFYGRSAIPGRGYTREFGILVAAENDLSAKGLLPESVHELDCIEHSGRWDGDGLTEEARYLKSLSLDQRNTNEDEDSDDGNEDSEEDYDDDDDDAASEHTIE